jgi:hypothetical protein
MARWAIVANLTAFVGIASSSVIIDVLDQSGAWSHWVVSGAALIATIHAAVIEWPRVRGWLLQRQVNRPSGRGKTNAAVTRWSRLPRACRRLAGRR